MEAGGCNVFVLSESGGGVSDGDCHGDDEVGGGSVSGEEEAETAMVDGEVTDAFGVVWEEFW